MADLKTLARLNRTAVFLGTLAVGLAGFFLPGVWGAALLYVIVAALGVLLARTWAVTAPGARAVRLVILAGLAVLATLKLFH